MDIMSVTSIVFIMIPVIFIYVMITTFRLARGTDSQTVKGKAKGVRYINKYIFPNNIEESIILEHTLRYGSTYQTHYLIIQRPSGVYYLTIYITKHGDYYKLDEIAPIIKD